MKPKEKIFEIDVTNLTASLCEQPGLFAYYAELEAEAMIAHDQAKGEYDIFVASTAKDLRGKPLEKKSETLIQQEVLLDPRVQAMASKVIEAKRKHSLLKVAVRALEQKLQALLALGRLEGGGRRNTEPLLLEEKEGSRSKTTPLLDYKRQRREEEHRRGLQREAYFESERLLDPEQE